MNGIDNEICRLKSEIDIVHKKREENLKHLDLFILDNSIRESTVGQLRSHTLEDKIQIYEQVKECGIEDIIVASFSDMKGVDDDFCQYLVQQQEDFSRLYSFSEVTEGLKDGVYDTETVPIALRKNKFFGMSSLKLILPTRIASGKRSLQPRICVNYFSNGLSGYMTTFMWMLESFSTSEIFHKP